MTPFREGDMIASRKRRAGSGQSWLAAAADGVAWSMMDEEPLKR